MVNSKHLFRLALGAMMIVVGLVPTAFGQAPAVPTPKVKVAPPRPDFPPHATVLKGFTKVVSTADGKPSFYTLYVRKKDQKILAELPRGYASQKHFLAMTISSGETYAGLQAGDLYFYWRRYNKRLAMIVPNTQTRSTGDPESRSSVKRLFTDQVYLDVPIMTIGPSGGPVIDFNYLFVNNASRFFQGAIRPSNTQLVTIKKSKGFPENVEVAFEIPTSGGRLQSLHYSVSLIKSNPKFRPRKADERVGYFVTAYNDLGKYKDDETRVRYINRWHLEKRSSKLAISPPVEPIVFYIEHTTPVRYRRWVREGIMHWNKAFEKIGLTNAIEAEYQDAQTGRHMEKDPEDVRWNFVRWLNNNIGTAIGPSRVNPTTGQILDADIILTDGWIRHFRNQFEKVLPKTAMQGFSPTTLAWLAENPSWDPRIRLAHPSNRIFLIEQLNRHGSLPFGGHPMTRVDSKLIGDEQYDGLIGRTSQINGMCLASEGKAFDVAMARMMLAYEAADDAKKEGEEKDKKKKDDDKKKDGEKKEKKLTPKISMLDGMPESFIGPLIADLVCHEVGHTLGLRHNFKASSIYSVDQVNSEEVKGKKAFAGSVMDYLPINMRFKNGKVRGDHTMVGIGPYDYWAIEYGYSFATDLKPILARVAEPELIYGTDEDTFGPDPLARRYDFGSDPLEYATDQMRLVKHHREHLIDGYVKKGESWSKARTGYELTLSLQMRATSMMANWVGGSFVHRDKKGDKNGRVPVQVVPVKMQRDALKFVIENSFNDSCWGLNPKMLAHMSVDKWMDGGFMFLDEATWPVHDRILGMQASTLTMLLNPSTLERVYDNEFRTEASKDMLTLTELMSKISTNIWSELNSKFEKKYTARIPFVTSLRRNLQQEHLNRVIKLSMPGAGFNEAYKPTQTLALQDLRRIRGGITRQLQAGGKKLDPYTRAHWVKCSDQISKAINAQHIYNVNEFPKSRSTPSFFFGKENRDELKNN